MGEASEWWPTRRGEVTTLLALVICTAAYYLLPLHRSAVVGTISSLAVFGVGLLLVSTLIVFQVARFRPRAREHSSLAGVVASLYLAVLFFSAVYFGLAWHYPGSVAQLSTRTDALYFALSITATVGFGDVHAVSQGARAVAAVHMAFNIGFLGVVVNLLRSRVRAR